jgi:hypothetical protein
MISKLSVAALAEGLQRLVRNVPRISVVVSMVNVKRGLFVTTREALPAVTIEDLESLLLPLWASVRLHHHALA